jgi:hypothetical protein
MAAYECQNARQLQDDSRYLDFGAQEKRLLCACQQGERGEWHVEIDVNDEA